MGMWEEQLPPSSGTGGRDDHNGCPTLSTVHRHSSQPGPACDLLRLRAEGRT